MSLPYSYKNKIVIPESEEADVEDVVGLYVNYFNSRNFVDFKFENGTMSFIADYSLVNFKYPVDINIIKEEHIHIEYEIHLMQLIKITLVLIVFIAFFSSFGMTGFLWFSFIFSVVFFLVNLMFADGFIQKLIKQSPFYQVLNPTETESLSDDQKKWLNDKNRCPACGEEINNYDASCPECGLRLKQNQYTIPLDVTKYKEKRFKYHYKKVNKKP